MAANEIDFQRIRSFGASQNHAFEELCSQLAALEPRAANTVFHRKGSGADAGVECYVRHADGTETGWQAKYFFAFGDSQIGQLDKSIKQVLSKHPQLNRYIVCIPVDLPDQRATKGKSQLQRWQDWAGKWTAAAKKQKRSLSIELWGKSELVERLGRDNPLYSGRAAFWFDETILTPAWFQSKFAQARAGLGQRYTPETNVELPIRRTILGFCRDPSLLQDIRGLGEKLEETRYDVIDSLKRLVQVVDFSKEAAAIEIATGALSSLLSATPADPDYVFPIAEMTSHADDAIVATAQGTRALYNIKPAPEKHAESIRYAMHELRELEQALDNILATLNGNRWRLVNTRRALVTGAAGVGKSHLFGDAVDHQVHNERPSILILGGTLIEDDPWTQIVKQLDLSISVEKFLGALDAAAQATGTRAVIFIDAINEHHGIAIWAQRLPGFLKAIEPFPRVAVAVSCRSTYLPYVFPDGIANDLPQIEHVGFAGRAAEAARYYLDKRGIVRMAAPNLIPEFENPLFLKTCCDYLAKEQLTEFPRGMRGVTEIFNFYTQAVAKAVERDLGLDQKLNTVAKALATLADAFDKGERGYLEYDKAAGLLDTIRSSNGEFKKSLLARLLSEGVLADEPVTDDTGGIVQIVRFSFERYSDHRIARLLLDQHLDGSAPKTSFAPGKPLHDYITSRSAYEHAGVIEAMAVQLPERCNLELSDAMPEACANQQLVANAFLSSVLWRDQKAFTKRTLELLQHASRMTGQDEALRVLIAVTSEPENAFNAEYLHDVLTKLPMPERDAQWSVYVAHEGDYEDSPIETLIAWTRQNGFEAIEAKRAELAAITLSWLFSTSHREIRDRATKALAALLAKRLDLAARLVERFKHTDDPYILERVIAASYGAALQGMTNDGLVELAQAAFTCVFDRPEPLPHVLIRDHARGLIEFAHVRGALPSSLDMKRVRPPYRSGIPEVVSEETTEAYKQEYSPGNFMRDDIVGSTVNDGDFARYVTDRPVYDFSSLPIAWIGRTERDIYEAWSVSLATRLPQANALLVELIAACDAWRANQPPPLSRFTLEIKLVKPGDTVEEDKGGPYEQAVDNVEQRLKAALGDMEWERYCNEARHLLRSGIHWSRRSYQWPPEYDARRGRRWICKRAHDLGWTPELFGEFDRQRGHGGRTEHRIERIGKKYQWIAFHELLARLGDNYGFNSGWAEGRNLSVFQGPWQVSRREMDPSLFASPPRENDDLRCDATWWMPKKMNLPPISPHARLEWLDSADDIVDDASLLSVTEPSSKRTWLVLDEYKRWNQWGLREGERTLDRYTAFEISCVLVHTKDRSKLAKALSGKIINSNHDLPKIDKTSEGYVGEYPWHPMFQDMLSWVSPSEMRQMAVDVQPTVTDYHASRSGYDFSIADSFGFNVPGPGLLDALKLHLSNGRELTYADDSNKVIFMDPSVREPGPGAALVDREAFLAFLTRASLEAVWIVTAEKEVYGGRKHQEGFGGCRSFTSIYWLTKAGFQKRHFEKRDKPTKEQLAKLFNEAGVVAPATRRKRSPALPAKKPSKKRRRTSGKTRTVTSKAPKAKVKPVKKAAKATKKRSINPAYRRKRK